MAKRTLGPSTSLSCGCMVGHELQSPYFPIRHCPLHAAAPELLRGCNAALAYLADPASKFEENRRTAREIISDAIAKAEEG